MSRTRDSLYYLASYLLLTGVGFLLAPSFCLKLLSARGSYDLVFVQFVGAFMIALGTLVTQIIRYRLSVLYPTTLGVRMFFLVAITWFFLTTEDPMFLFILGVVGLGFVLTGVTYLADRRDALRASAAPGGGSRSSPDSGT